MDDRKALVSGVDRTAYGSIDGEVVHLSTGEHDSSEKPQRRKSSCQQMTKVLSATVFMCFCSTGLLLSLGVFYVEFLDFLQSSHAETSLIQSTTFTVFGLSGFLSGVLIRWCGSQRSGMLGGCLVSCGLILSFWGANVYYFVVCIGIITGFGIGLTFVTAMTYCGVYFEGNRAILAMSLSSMGAGIGGVVLPTIIVAIQDEYGLLGTLMILGGILLNIIPASGLLTKVDVTSRKKNRLRANGSERRCNNCRLFCRKLRRLFKTPEYLFGPVCVSFSCSVLSVPSMVLVDFFESRGYERQTGVYALLLMNLVNAFGRLFPGLSKQVPRISSYHTPLLTAMLSGGAGILIFYVNSFPVILICVSLFGLAFGTLISSIYTTSSKIIDRDMFSTATGIATSFQGIFTSIAGPLTGYIKDQTGTYDWPFLIFGGVLLVCSFLMFCGYLLRIRHNRAYRRLR